MSQVSKIVLGLSCTLSAGIILYVHYSQWADQKRLHEGVLRDIERQQRKKIENIYFLQQQAELTKELKRKEAEQALLGLS